MITLKSAKGACTPSAEKLPVGTYHVVATYNGSADFGGSTSATETLTAVRLPEAHTERAAGSYGAAHGAGYRRALPAGHVM